MDEDKSARLARAVSLAASPLEAEIIPLYYRTVGSDDVESRTPEQLARIVSDHVGVGRDRRVGEDCVVVNSPGSIDIVTDDMPFLVDSITGALLRADHDIALLIHPQILAHRSATGVIESIGEGGIAESWTHIEVEPLDDTELTALPVVLRSVLVDVRLAVNDWTAMRARALALADELGAHPPVGLDSSEAEDAQELLRWMVNDNFTFVGYREYGLAAKGDADVLRAEPDSALGVMRHDLEDSTSFAKLSPEARVIALEPHLLVLTKANRRSTVHRPVYLDYVGVKKFDSDGHVVGEHRFLGLYAATAYSQSVTEIPVVRRKVQRVVASTGLLPHSHDQRDLLQFLETYPRDELFEIHVERLEEIALEVVQMQERRQTRMFLRYDDYGRFVSALVYLPRDRYTTSVRERMQGVLRDAFDATSVDFTARVSESVLARLHFLVRVEVGRSLPRINEEELEQALGETTKSWDDRFHEELVDSHGIRRAGDLRERFEQAFPEAYKEDFAPADALRDVATLLELEGERAMSVRLYRPPSEGDSRERRLALTMRGAGVSLSEVLPVLQALRVGVIDERPYGIDDASGQAWVYDFGITLLVNPVDEAELAARFEDAFLALWQGRLDHDGFAALVVVAGLTWRQVALVQTLMEYARQLGAPFSRRYCEDVLALHGQLVADIVDLFESRLDPDRLRASDADALAAIESSLDAIASLDEDRIVRSLLTVVLAIVRTSYYQRADDASMSDVIAVKLLPNLIPEAPRPRPEFEIWVHSPRVSGVHLRFGSVARGGLRWSDRREDFRTEVLGLVKAQMVKNAVIVPVGAKGGFVCLQSVDTNDREAVQAEGIACYRLFVSALLEISDNLVNGAIVPPERVVRLDGDDPYLVVAADKGTATFSDIANGIALEHGFWLGDAFASGGSAGYDHKAMAITARGAWESVKRHFRGLGVDVQADDFTVVGIGDMSGDVFGNGMLLSEHIRLVAAFDHRHVFLDPSPDAAVAFVERRRLFDLPRSSWADYDSALISAGGGVYPRSAKSVPVSEQVRVALGLPEGLDEMAPNDLLRAILHAPVDLVWNGGIGTYVKATSESNLDVGDKSNDAIRVNGGELRCRVVGEGGNLGLTQLGRIEAARNGVLLTTDAIDNSAGVDTSDHEVNIKILLDAAVRDGALAVDERTPFLESMTDQVADLVLADNYEQNLVLATDFAQSSDMVSVHRRLLTALEQRGAIDRALEGLPSETELERRVALGQGLVLPELAMLLAHVKIGITADLLPAVMANEPWCGQLLRSYFPTQLAERFADRLGTHPLANEIVTTMVSNSMVNDGGTTYFFRIVEETGATAIEIARAYQVATEAFDLPELWSRIRALDGVAPPAVQTELLLETRRLLDRATRWMLQTRGRTVDVNAEVAILRPELRRLAPMVPGVLRGGEAQRLRLHIERLVAAGSPEPLAADVAVLLDLFSLLDIIDVSRRVGSDPVNVATLYFAVSERFGGDLLLHRITNLPRPDRWATLARASLRSDLYTALAALTARISRATPEGLDPLERIDLWESGQPEGVTRAHGTLSEITALDTADIATLSVALRALRALVAQGGQQTPVEG